MEQINQTNQKLPNLPNATLVLVFGILSIAICSFIGLAFGITALILSKKEKEKYLLSPDNYSKNSFGMLNAGRTCALIGTIISSVATLLMIIYLIFIGLLLTALSNNQCWF